MRGVAAFRGNSFKTSIVVFDLWPRARRAGGGRSGRGKWHALRILVESNEERVSFAEPGQVDWSGNYGLPVFQRLVDAVRPDVAISEFVERRDRKNSWLFLTLAFPNGGANQFNGEFKVDVHQFCLERAACFL